MRAAFEHPATHADGKWFFYTTICIATLLLMVWPLPSSIALRNILLGLLAVSVFWLNFRLRNQNVPVLLPKWPAIILLILTVWIVTVIVLWGQEPLLSWGEFWPQWCLPLVSGLMAWGLVRLAIFYKKQDLLIKVVFYTFFVQVAAQDIINIVFYFSVGVEPFRLASVLYIPKIVEYWFDGVHLRQAFDANLGEKVSFINNLFLGLVLAEAGQRIATGKSYLKVSNLLLVIGLLSAGLCSYWLNIRNGSIGFLILLFLFFLFAYLSIKDSVSKKKRVGFVALSLVLLLSALYFLTKNDSRWERFKETAELVAYGESTNAWLLVHNQVVYPLSKDGLPVDGSTYLRLSWIKEGLKMIQKYPLGTGFNRNAFFDTVDREYKLGGMVRGGHSHSGMIDFFIANGVVGGLLWILFLCSSVYYGFKVLKSGSVSQGLVVIFFAIGFLHRGFVDSNIRDHVLQQFMFLLFVYMALNLNPSVRVLGKKENV